MSLQSFMHYQGFYLNLSRSQDRRNEIEQELARVKSAESYRRIEAVDGRTLKNDNYHLKNLGAVGCFLSHVAACREVVEGNIHRHIIEDDVVFSINAKKIIEQIITSGQLDEFDILMTDFDQALVAEKIQSFKSLYDQVVECGPDRKITKVAFQLIDLRDVDFTSAASYLVNQKSIEKLLDLFDAEIAQGIRLPIDDFYRLQAQVGAIRVGCVFPFITAVRIEHAMDSTIRAQPDMTRRFTARNLVRYSFFTDCDWKECNRLLDEHIPKLNPDDQHEKILARLLTYPLAKKI